MKDNLKIREQFPTLFQEVNGHPLSYLDNAASTQRPKPVIDAIDHYYNFDNANIHRGVHTLSQRGTLAFENARETIKSFINAQSTKECIFVKGTTEAINLVATCLEREVLKENDEILVSMMEHHSNIIPWQIAAKYTGAKVKSFPINEDGTINLEAFQECITKNTKVIAVNHVSNTLGTVNPIKEIVKIAKEFGIITVIDGAQAPGHVKVDVQDIGCDFYTVSAHKMYGPMGIGTLYGKQELLEKLPPYQGGGDMIETVSFSGSTYNELPFKFEAGTPNVASVIGFARAIEFLNELNRDEVSEYEGNLHRYMEEGLLSLKGLKIIGTAKHKTCLTSFVIDGLHPHDIGTISDQHGVAIRTGHHCTMPLMEFYNVPATSRASLALYNNKSDVDQLIYSLDAALKLFKKK